MSILRVGSYNICHGFGLDRRIDLQRTAAVLRQLDCDLVAVQEVDVGCRRSGQVDQAAELARLTGMTACFAPAIPLQGGVYGNLVLSRLPVLGWHTWPLPGDEPRCLAAVDLMWEGLRVRFCGTHLDLNADCRERSLPSLQGAAERPRVPFVVAGDFNSAPDSAIIRHLTAVWQASGSLAGAATYPADAPTERIDYILAGPAGRWRVVSMEVVPEASSSDHRPIRADLELVGDPS